MASTELSLILKNISINKNPITLGKMLTSLGFKQTHVGEGRIKKYKIKLTDFYYESIKGRS